MDLVSQLLHSDPSTSYKNMDNEKGASNISDHHDQTHQKQGRFFSKKYIVGALLAASVGVNCYLYTQQGSPVQAVSMQQTFSAGDLSERYAEFIENLNETIAERLSEREERFYDLIEEVQERFAEKQEEKTEKLNRLIDQLAEREELLDSLENKTLSEIADAATNAYVNYKYTFVSSSVYDSETGLPIPNATVRVYDDWYNQYYEQGATYDVTTDANGMTSEFQLDNEKAFYVTIAAPGYTTHQYQDGFVEVAYFLDKTPPAIKVVSTWTVSNDIDSYVYANQGVSYYRERDIMSAPGGETFTLTNFISGTKFLVSAHLYSFNGFATSGLVVSIYKDDVLVATASPDANTTSTQQNWLAGCFTSDAVFTPIGTFSDYTYGSYDVNTYC